MLFRSRQEAVFLSTVSDDFVNLMTQPASSISQSANRGTVCVDHTGESIRVFVSVYVILCFTGKKALRAV